MSRKKLRDDVLGRIALIIFLWDFNLKCSERSQDQNGIQEKSRKRRGLILFDMCILVLFSEENNLEIHYSILSLYEKIHDSKMRNKKRWRWKKNGI